MSPTPNDGDHSPLRPLLRTRRPDPRVASLILLVGLGLLGSSLLGGYSSSFGTTAAASAPHGAPVQSSSAPHLISASTARGAATNAQLDRIVPVGTVHSRLHAPIAHADVPPYVCASCGYYLQEGSVLDQLCFVNVSGPCTSVPGLSAIHFDVTIRTTTFSTGFEVAAISNQGDWYKTSVLYNWCGPGFAIGNAAYNLTGYPVFATPGGNGCFKGPNMSAGEVMRLGMYVSSTGNTSGDVCFTATDLTTPNSPYTKCIAQPDGGSSPSTNYFVTGALSGSLGGRTWNYFTGVMTEVANRTTTGCLDWHLMPQVAFQMVPGAYVNQATPFTYQGNPLINQCYIAQATAPWTFQPGNASYRIADGTAHSLRYGPHWLGAQNISGSSSTNTWEFDTDAIIRVPSQTLFKMDEGQYSSVVFSDDVTGANINGWRTTVNWSYSPGLGSCLVTNFSVTLDCTPGGPAVSSVTVGVLEVGGYGAYSPIAVFTVYPDPTVHGITVTPKSLDVNQTTTLVAQSSGGSGGTQYLWSDLPPGCASANSATIHCKPTGAGMFNTTVHVNDSEGYSATGYSGYFHVYTVPNITIAAPGAVTRYIDLGQGFSATAVVTGGSGGYIYNWTGGPPGCTGATSASYSCVSQHPGPITLNFGVTDSNGVTVRIHAFTIQVYAALTATPESTSIQANVGHSLAIVVNVSGGDPPYISSWSGLPSGCISANTTGLSCTPTGSGTFTVVYSVRDALGGWSNATITVSLSNTVAGTGLSVTQLAIIGVVVVAVVAATLAAVLLRRRSGSAPREPPPMADEPESAPPDEAVPDSP